MSKIKTLSILVGILALINIGLIIFLLIGRPGRSGPDRHGGKEKAEQLIKERFGFDEEQMKAFGESKSKHMMEARKLETSLDEVSQAYYMTNSNEGNQLRDSLMSEIKRISENIYANNARHFDEVRGICKPGQEAELDNFIHSLIRPKKKRNNRGSRKNGYGRGRK